MLISPCDPRAITGGRVRRAAVANGQQGRRPVGKDQAVGLRGRWWRGGQGRGRTADLPILDRAIPDQAHVTPMSLALIIHGLGV
jgi:hypothetical protein